MANSKIQTSTLAFTGVGACLLSMGCSAGMSNPDSMDMTANGLGHQSEPQTQCPTACEPHTCQAVSPSDALITNWKDIAPGGMFVDDDSYANPSPNWWESFFGGPYVYPAIDPCSDGGLPAYPLAQTTAGKWNITGRVGAWSGFGLWFAPCSVDMSAYRGVSLAISGDVGETATLNFNVITSEDSKPSECLTNVGMCDPETNTCAAPGKKLPIPSKPSAPVTILWSELSGGSPMDGVDPTQIVGFHFSFDRVDWNGAVTPPFPVDVTVGSIQLVK